MSAVFETVLGVVFVCRILFRLLSIYWVREFRPVHICANNAGQQYKSNVTGHGLAFAGDPLLQRAASSGADAAEQDMTSVPDDDSVEDEDPLGMPLTVGKGS